MLDIGWMELLVIGVVALIVVGPKDLPVMFRTAGQFMGKARAMAREFQRSMEDAAKESGLSESAKQLNSLSSTLNTKLNLTSATNSARRYAENAIKDGDARPAAGTPAAGGAATQATAPAPDTAPVAAAAVAPATAGTTAAAKPAIKAKVTGAPAPSAETGPAASPGRTARTAPAKTAAARPARKPRTATKAEPPAAKDSPGRSS
jgi:sec-independent protein translocase protein TatB